MRRHQGTLPHWQQTRTITFVTFRLADSVAAQVRVRWRAEQLAWEIAHPEPHDEATRAEFHRRFSARREAWLDAGHGACWLLRPEVAREVEDTLPHLDGEAYSLGDYVIMPNHVHALVCPLGQAQVGEIVAAWKSCSARRINTLLGRKGTVWMNESFDHLVRHEAQLEKLRSYIRDNPAKAGLRAGEYIWRAAEKVWPAPPPAKR